MSVRKRGRRYYVTEIDITDEVEEALDEMGENEALNQGDTLFVRNCIDDARACLNRRERSPAEALMHMENALRIINQRIKAT